MCMRCAYDAFGTTSSGRVRRVQSDRRDSTCTHSQKVQRPDTSILLAHSFRKNTWARPYTRQQNRNRSNMWRLEASTAQHCTVRTQLHTLPILVPWCAVARLWVDRRLVHFVFLGTCDSPSPGIPINQTYYMYQLTSDYSVKLVQFGECRCVTKKSLIFRDGMSVNKRCLCGYVELLAI